MTTLFDYQKDLQRFVRDKDQALISPEDLRVYINRARREIAMKAQCIRVLPPTSGAIVGWNVQTGGSGYTSAPTCVVTPPDYPNGQLPFPDGKQALATAIVQGGVIVAIESSVRRFGVFPAADDHYRPDRDGGYGYGRAVAHHHAQSGAGAIQLQRR